MAKGGNGMVAVDDAVFVDDDQQDPGDESDEENG